MPSKKNRSQWLENVELTPENNIYKLDASGRIIIPTYIRNKFDIEIGDFFDYYTTRIDGKWYLCVCKVEDEELPDNKLKERNADRARIAERERVVKEEMEKLEKAKNEGSAKV